MHRFTRSATLALFLLSGSAAAGPVAEFEAGFRPVYASYREALFATNSGKPDPSAAALAGLAEGWAALRAAYGAAPPPQYADDPQWAATLDSVTGLITAARAQAGAGDLAEAHETLEAVREEIGALHARNGVETFSDRMNAYHAEMEHVLASDAGDLGTDGVPALRERAAVLAYLADDLMAAPPPEAAGNPAWDELSAAFVRSVESFREAVRSGSSEAIGAAIDGLKGPYARLFLKFG